MSVEQIGESTEHFLLFYEKLRKEIPIEYSDCANTESIKHWIRGNYKKQHQGIEISTAVSDIRHVYEFAQFVKLDPDEIIKDAMEIKDRNSTDRFKWEDVLEKWEDELNRSSDKRNTTKKKLQNVMAFFDKNRIKLVYDLPSGESPGTPWAPDLDLMRRAVELTDKKVVRAWIFMQAQCGLSEIDLLKYDVDKSNHDPDKEEGVLYDSLRSQYRRGIVPITLVKPRQKTGILTVTFLGEEAASLVDIHDNHLFPWKVDGAKDPARQIRREFEDLSEQLGEARFAPHKLRRYFKTTLTQKAQHVIEKESVNIMSGHAQKGIDRFYQGAWIDLLRKKYIAAYDYLRFYPKEEFNPTLWKENRRLI